MSEENIFKNIIFSIKDNKLNLIERIFNNYKEVNFLISKDNNGENLLHKAVYTWNLQCIKLIMREVQNKLKLDKNNILEYFNQMNNKGQTALDILIENLKNWMEIGKCLFENGVKSRKNIFYDIDDSFLSLNLACLNGEIQTVDKILQNNKDINFKKLTQKGLNPFHYAILSGESNIVKLLIKYKESEQFLLQNKELLIDFASNKIIKLKEIINILKENGKEVEKQNFDRLNNIDKLKNDLGIKNVIKLNAENNDYSNYDYIKINKNIPPRGLKNIGRTCYMNTILQCFYHVKELSEYFLNLEKNDSYYFENKPFSKAYLSVVKGLSNEKNLSYAFEPLEFFKELISISKKYADDNGSDPKDVVLDILYNLYQDSIDSESSASIDNNIDKTNKRKLFDYYREDEKRYSSKLSELFSWCYQETKQCPYCNKYSYNFEFNNLIIFHLKSICKKIKPKEKILDLEKDCFGNYFSTKKNYEFTCQNKNCSKKVKGLVSTSICVLPKILIIILNRGKDDKFNCPVGLENKINISKYYEQIDKTNIDPEYELLCATFLMGESKKDGHTFAFCKHFDDKFYIFNDCKVSKPISLDFRNLRNSSMVPFILFYKRTCD